MSKAMRDESYPAIPEWISNQAKLHEAITVAQDQGIAGAIL